MDSQTVVQPTDAADNISIVLVKTHSAGNVGAAARAMKNMGFSRLKLVNPGPHLNDECRAMARRAFDLVRAAPIYSSLDQALGGENVVVGTTSARDRRWRQPLHTPRELSERIWRHAQRQRVALLFGPERRGLTDAQLARCQHLISIPTQTDFPVLNLAQSVLLVCYELFLARTRQSGASPQLASDRERERMFAQMEAVLIGIGFLSSRNPHPVMRSIRRFLGRAELSSRDVRILRGLMSQMEWYLQKGHELPPEKVRKP